MKSRWLKTLAAVCAICAPAAWAQQAYPETLWIPITIYDFHSNGSCPEFEMNSWSGVVVNMVDSTLDAQRKPVLGDSARFVNSNPQGPAGANPYPWPYYNRFISKWYRPWTSGDFTKAHWTTTGYQNAGTPMTYQAYGRYDGVVSTPGNDTGYKNIVIQDTLPFLYVANSQGVYQYTNANFFPVDGRGFGNEVVEDNTPGYQRAEGDSAFAHNFSFAVELHRTFTKLPNSNITFNFAGDDDVWAFVNNKLAMDLGGRHGTEAGSFAINDIAARFGLVDNHDYNFDFFFAERHSGGSDVSITTNIVSSIAQKLTLSVENDTISAGDSVSIAAKIFDQADSLRTDLMQLVKWNLVNPVTAGDKILSTAGPSTTFTGTQAYHTALIAAVYLDQTTGKVLTDTSHIYIKPGPASQVVIEQASATQLSQANVTSRANFKITASPLSIIVMDDSTFLRYAYAVVRDKYGNFVSMATTASWASTSANLATVAGTSAKLWEGRIDRLPGASGSLNIIASESGLLPDTVPLQMQTGVITALRFVDNSGAVLSSIHINTDQVQYVKVQATWSNNPGVWVDVSGAWSMSPLINSANAIPSGEAGDWTFSPTEPGSANLTVSAGGKSVTIPVTVDIAPPSTITINILTPSDSLIAGYPIRLELRIYNTDGLVPLQYCNTSTFTDAIGTGVNKPAPFIVINNGSINDTLFYGTGGSECFNGGVDTVTTTLFNAPYLFTDSLHQISVAFNGLTGQSTQFRLLPGPIATLQLQHSDGEPMPADTTIAYPDGALTILSVSYDQYGNKIGAEVSTWGFSGTLHTASVTRGSQIYYAANNVTGDEQGSIIATSTTDVDVKASMNLLIQGPATRLDSAVTLDLNANGYLDAIRLVFDKKVSFPANYDLSKILLSATETVPATNFTVDSIEAVPGSDSTVFILYLNENTSGQIPQTGWRPYLTMDNLPGVANIDNVQCFDGAPPVVWEVDKKVNSTGDRTQDIVTITFSEPIFGADGSPLRFSNPPATLFNAWVIENGDTVVIDSMFKGIGLLSNVGTNSVSFYMTNGNDLTGNNFVNFVTNPSVIADAAGNKPLAINQKVRVVVEGDIGNVHIGPNPMFPVFSHFETQLTNHNPQEAFTWAKNDGGAVMEADILLPSESSVPIFTAKAALLIFDNVGNLTYSARNDDNVIPADWQTGRTGGEVRQLVFYWNGITSENRKAAPGIYRTILYISTDTKQQKFVGNIGIAR